MATPQLDPQQVIDLVSSDSEPSPNIKKRPLEEAPDSDTSRNHTSSSTSSRKAKRAKKNLPPTAKPEPAGSVAQANGNSKTLLPEEHQPATASASQDKTTMTKRNVPTGPAAVEQQRRYFPAASDPTLMCLLCGRGTHLAANCPTLICSFCGSLEHPDLCCPSRERCKKCRQLGHQAGQCVEKLSLTRGEGLACDICDSPNHLEEECTQVWRSFRPEDGTINKVAFIPAFCAACGSDSHFCADCTRRRDTVPNPTWSLKNRDRYLDPDCGSSSIEETGRGRENARTTRAPELKIRGHAARTTNIHYSSDDSDGDFLSHSAVKQKVPPGQIRVASNIQMPQNATSRGDRPPRGNNGRGQHQLPPQPPLPPGPPPSGPPSRQGSFGYPPPPGVSTYGTRPAAPPPSLPAKPPASTRDYRNVPPPPDIQAPRGQSYSGNQPQGSRGRGGQRGGRGGRGGRGRGRGRGRGK
ncbi:hypothetical protein QQZ08_005637 [Neonectria magnoliae]|uniref:CCHC-type domain-containing protein n=1 Tax=Neonectria magnoliae TaxID=2732573 RepID=A0ABR1I4B2_9HYPO